jgi:uracil-DNA glycosylase
MRKVICSKNSIYDFESGRQTFKPIIYTSWGILNGFCPWGEMPNVEDEPGMLEAIRSIAYINVKKLPGKTESRDEEIQKAYHKNRDILLRQIEAYDPDIIIGGSTLNYFLEDLGVTEKATIDPAFDSVHYFVHNGRILIGTYHPSQRVMRQEKYCDDIIQVIRQLTSAAVK